MIKKSVTDCAGCHDQLVHDCVVGGQRVRPAVGQILVDHHRNPEHNVLVDTVPEQIVEKCRIPEDTRLIEENTGETDTLECLMDFDSL